MLDVVIVPNLAYPAAVSELGEVRPMVLLRVIATASVAGVCVNSTCRVDANARNRGSRNHAKENHWTHFAKFADGRWVSKIGDDHDIEHDSLRSFEGEAYGYVVRILSR